MKRKDLCFGTVQTVITAMATDITTTTSSSAFDRTGSGAAGCKFVINAGTLTATSGTWTISLTECLTSGGTYTPVAAGDVTGSPDVISFDDDNTVHQIGYGGLLPFVKVVLTADSVSGGTTNGFGITCESMPDKSV